MTTAITWNMGKSPIEGGVIIRTLCSWIIQVSGQNLLSRHHKSAFGRLWCHRTACASSAPSSGTWCRCGAAAVSWLRVRSRLRAPQRSHVDIESQHANCNKLTCQHALINDAGAKEQNGIAVKSTAVGWDDNYIARNQVLGAHRVHCSIPSAHFNYITALHRVPQLGLVLKGISARFESCGKKFCLWLLALNSLFASERWRWRCRRLTWWRWRQQSNNIEYLTKW